MKSIKNIKSFLLAALAFTIVSCSNADSNYDSAALKFVESAGAMNAEMTAVFEEKLKGGSIDEVAWAIKAEKQTNTLMEMACYNGELLSDENRESMKDKVGKKTFKIEMVSCEIVRSATLRDGNVAVVEIEMLKKEGGTTRTIQLIMKNIDGRWKVEVNNWGKDISDIQEEFKAKMTN